MTAQANAANQDAATTQAVNITAWQSLLEAVMNSMDADQSQIPAYASLLNVLRSQFDALQNQYWGPNGVITQDTSDINKIANSGKTDTGEQQKFTDATNKYNNDMANWNTAQTMVTNPINQTDSQVSAGLTAFQQQVSQLQTALQAIASAYTTVTQG